MLYDHNLEQLVEEPTREENTLDLIISNCPQLIQRVEVLPGLSDHAAVYCEVMVHSRKRKQTPRSIPLYNKADWEKFKEYVDSVSTNIFLLICILNVRAKHQIRAHESYMN